MVAQGHYSLPDSKEWKVSLLSTLFVAVGFRYEFSLWRLNSLS